MTACSCCAICWEKPWHLEPQLRTATPKWLGSRCALQHRGARLLPTLDTASRDATRSGYLLHVFEHCTFLVFIVIIGLLAQNIKKC